MAPLLSIIHLPSFSPKHGENTKKGIQMFQNLEYKPHFTGDYMTDMKLNEHDVTYKQDLAKDEAKINSGVPRNITSTSRLAV